MVLNEFTNMTINELTSAIYNDVTSGLVASNSNPTISLDQLADEVVDTRAAVVLE